MKRAEIQSELVRRAIENPHHVVSVDWGYWGKRRYGRRQIDAARKLVAEGRFALVCSTSDQLYKHRYGVNGRAYSTTFKLVEGGR